MTNSYITATSNLHFTKPVGRGCSYYIAEMRCETKDFIYDPYNFILLMDEDYDFRVLERLQRANDFLAEKNIKILIAGERKGTISVVLSSLLPVNHIKTKLENLLADGRDGDNWNVAVYFGAPLSNPLDYDDDGNRLGMLAHPAMPEKVYFELMEKVLGANNV